MNRKIYNRRMNDISKLLGMTFTFIFIVFYCIITFGKNAPIIELEEKKSIDKNGVDVPSYDNKENVIETEQSNSVDEIRLLKIASGDIISFKNGEELQITVEAKKVIFEKITPFVNQLVDYYSDNDFEFDSHADVDYLLFADDFLSTVITITVGQENETLEITFDD